MYRISLTSKTKRELKKLKVFYDQNVISDAFDELKANPYEGKPLARELSGKFSYRLGRFRIIYKIDEKTKVISILTIGHRSTVYN